MLYAVKIQTTTEQRANLAWVNAILRERQVAELRATVEHLRARVAVLTERGGPVNLLIASQLSKKIPAIEATILSWMKWESSR